ncbi:ubiquinone biosynthesis O-methyltransferase [Sodiomyces alkalinus F11]|uniref:Ubiquinone biosynthesis O-methyltransferase, mitochondrial n=1 Tax=Sodiomyces alkalinus (strain CBS 110278 / VKM F-3762 / F11) TaxID=1314773 RepID=A0A3N2PQ64_SODAK|nr:ubiquinone biosynthesis O-methyltransferase [Sodiomyces alkalinus F11]ROT36570.1 ubiquinone biosynthesis O-methyltransferase [Sodiomyces alkalinus F11]
MAIHSRSTTTALLRQLSRASSSRSILAPRQLTAPSPCALPLSPAPPSRRPSSTFSSVNPEEISHFNSLASSWWDPQGPSRLLHLMNPLRHDFIRECRSSSSVPDPMTASSYPSHNLRYLDIGCGGGIFAESAARLPTTASVTAIDPSPEVLSVARAHARRDPSLRPPRLNYLSATVETLPPPESDADRFDVVSVFEVVEHVDEPVEFLRRCAAFVRPGGWLVGSTIARTWLSWFTTNLVAEDILRIVPPGTHDWNKYIDDGELRGWFAGSDWTNARIMGVVYVPGLGWREVNGSEKVGNYFFGFRKSSEGEARGEPLEKA